MDRCWLPGAAFLALVLPVLITTGIVLSLAIDSVLGAAYIISYPYLGLCAFKWLATRRVIPVIASTSGTLELTLTSASLVMFRGSQDVIIVYSLRIREILVLVCFFAGVIFTTTFYCFPKPEPEPEPVPNIRVIIEDSPAAVTETCPQYSCPICRDNGNNLVKLEACGHEFHYDCVAKWQASCVARQLPCSCPLCRTTLEVV